jgi:uncharacterized protein DUF6457
VNDWLSQRADALARVTGIERSAFELTDDDVDRLLDLAGYAAHESDARTNAPLLCYLVGVARSADASLDSLDQAVRSSS